MDKFVLLVAIFFGLIAIKAWHEDAKEVGTVFLWIVAALSLIALAFDAGRAWVN